LASARPPSPVVGGIAAGETDVDRPDVGIALGVQLEDLEGLLGLLLVEQLAAVEVDVNGPGGAVVERLVEGLGGVRVAAVGGLELRQVDESREILLPGGRRGRILGPLQALVEMGLAPQ